MRLRRPRVQESRLDPQVLRKSFLRLNLAKINRVFCRIDYIFGIDPAGPIFARDADLFTRDLPWYWKTHLNRADANVGLLVFVLKI